MTMKKKQQLNVLVVEDDLISQELMKEMLDRLDCIVDIAGNGRQALKRLTRKDYDLVFMDLQMPEMDGFETTYKIREHEKGQKRTKIIALTASGELKDQKKCLERGMNDYLAKPIELQDLEQMLNKHFPER